MDFSLLPHEEAFRKELNDWLDVNLKEIRQRRGKQGSSSPDIDSEEAQQFNLWWQKKLHDAGYVGIAWPKEYGGRGATIMEQVILRCFEISGPRVHRGASRPKSVTYSQMRERGI